MEHFILSSGYLAIFLFMVAQATCIPIPSEVTMVLGGALASSHFTSASAHTHLNLVVVIVVGVAGDLAGSYIAWWLGRVGGVPAVAKLGRLAHVREGDVERAERWFRARGELAVPLGKVVPLVRSFISLAAGIAEVPAVRFGLYVAGANLVWSTGLALGGYKLADSWHTISKDFSKATIGVVAVAVVAAAAGVLWYVRRARATASPGTPDPPGDGA